MARGFIILSILVAILAVAFGEWAVDTTTSATVLAGVGTSSDDVAVAAASQNGVGSFIENYQNGKWTKKTVQAGLLLDSAITPSGNVAATSMWTVFVSNDGGNTYTSVDGLSGLSQSANVYGPGQEYFGLVGSWAVADPNSKVPTSVSGVATSTDGGKTWSISSSVPIGYVRYGAFPSENTWYIASGMWAEDSKLRGTSRKFQLSKRIEHSLSGASFFEKGYKAAGNETGWFGAVSKTTDAGKTWTQVLITDLEKDALYFNGISCSSDSHCAVVAEGEDAEGNYKTVIYVTFDAGNTWTQSLITQDVGLMQVKFISETEGWAAGTGKSGRGIVGQFYHTNDGGKSWTLQQSLSNCFTLDLDFAATKGYAACCTSSGSSCSAAVYSA